MAPRLHLSLSGVAKILGILNRVDSGAAWDVPS